MTSAPPYRYGCSGSLPGPASIHGSLDPSSPRMRAVTVVQSKPSETKSGYVLEGTLLEACSCGVLCPCWIGEDPDGGACDAFNAYHFDSGTIRGIDVSGLNFVRVVHIPGNVLTPASWKQVVFVDERASD